MKENLSLYTFAIKLGPTSTTNWITFIFTLEGELYFWIFILIYYPAI